MEKYGKQTRKGTFLGVIRTLSGVEMGLGVAKITPSLAVSQLIMIPGNGTTTQFPPPAPHSLPHSLALFQCDRARAAGGRSIQPKSLIQSAIVSGAAGLGSASGGRITSRHMKLTSSCLHKLIARSLPPCLLSHE